MTHIKPVIAALALIGLAACSGSKTEQPSSTTKAGRTA